MIWPALRDWLVILASVPKSLTLVLQSKTSSKREPAAVHGGNVKVLGWFQDGLYVELIAKSFSWNEFLRWSQCVGLWKSDCTWDLNDNWTQEHSTWVLRTSMFLQLKAAGLEPWPALRDWLSILASVPKYWARVSQSKTRKEMGARRRPWRQLVSFGLVLRGALRYKH